MNTYEAELDEPLTNGWRMVHVRRREWADLCIVRLRHEDGRESWGGFDLGKVSFYTWPAECPEDFPSGVRYPGLSDRISTVIRLAKERDEP